ncbi:MAG: sugar phosphate isomerase/epimerase [Eubacteriales bacterium]|nr:sugar phosphate isomerase/epimerase [Eubacteriales bacterium]
MNDFGMPTLIETLTLEECAALCGALNLQFIELNMNLPQYQLNQMDIAHANEIATQYGIYYTLHLDENLNISDFNPYIAQAYSRTVLETIALAKLLGSPVLNMHLSSGVYFTLPNQRVYLFDRFKDVYLKSITEFRDRCEQAIGGANIAICIENSDGYQAFQIEAIDLLLESPCFGLTYDIGHNYRSGGADEKIILKRKDRLCHMHLHDATEKKDHLALGTGVLDLQKYLTLADEANARIVLETKSIAGLTESVRWLQKSKDCE